MEPALKTPYFKHALDFDLFQNSSFGSGAKQMSVYTLWLPEESQCDALRLLFVQCEHFKFCVSLRHVDETAFALVVLIRVFWRSEIFLFHFIVADFDDVVPQKSRGSILMTCTQCEEIYAIYTRFGSRKVISQALSVTSSIRNIWRAHDYHSLKRAYQLLKQCTAQCKQIALWIDFRHSSS